MKAALKFLRLIDAHDGMISLTNVALLVVLVKIAIAPEVTIVDAGALFVALLSYQGKKVIGGQGIKAARSAEDAKTHAQSAMEMAGDLIKRVDELSSKVSQQQMAMGIKEIRR